MRKNPLRETLFSNSSVVKESEWKHLNLTEMCKKCIQESNGNKHKDLSGAQYIALGYSFGIGTAALAMSIISLLTRI